jgi:superfamily II DNA/RNA helicase
MVINFEMPLESENYLHRMVRSKHFGRSGLVLSIVLDNDKHLLKDIQQLHDFVVDELI